MPWKEKAIKRRGQGEREPELSFFLALTFVFAFPTTKNLYRTGGRSSLSAEVSHSKRKLIGKRDTSDGLRRVLSCSRDHLFGRNLLVFQTGFVESSNVDNLRAVSYFSFESKGVRGEQWIGWKRLRKPESLLVFTINLHNFTFSLAARGSEERTARSLQLMWNAHALLRLHAANVWAHSCYCANCFCKLFRTWLKC